MRSLRGETPGFVFPRIGEKPAELDVQELGFRFGGVTALNRISFRVCTGEMFAIVGPNGSGKTTLLNCISGRYPAKRGRILFNGKEITNLSPHRRVKAGIGKTSQRCTLFPDMTVLANLLTARHVHDPYDFGSACFFTRSVRDIEVRHRAFVEAIMDFLGLYLVRTKIVATLSPAMRKRVEIARALATEPALLLLDEPFSGMTPEENDYMRLLLSELNVAWNQTIIVAENDLSSVMGLSSRILALDFGVKIAEGSSDFVQNHPQVIKAFLGDGGSILS